jgi:hypothetical protein
VITLHPSLLGGTEKSDPWGIAPSFLGPRYAYDVLVHECIHLAIGQLRGGRRGPTSHNCDNWIAEVNRLAPLLGFHDVRAGRSKTVRPGKEKPRRGTDGM